MASPGNVPSATFKFNSFQEIKSHSSILYNERMAILFYMLDLRSIDMNMTYDVPKVLEVKSILWQIYKNIRMLFRFNPTMRATMNLDTKEKGIYTTDVGFALVNQMITHCEENGYSARKLYIIAQELNKIEFVIKDVLQYFQYFIRPEFKQKPDIETATEKYKEMADKRTVEQLRSLVGKHHKINWDELGTTRIELNKTDGYDRIVDGRSVGADDDDNIETYEDGDEEREMEPVEEDEHA
jgi:hypothetical protein